MNKKSGLIIGNGLNRCFCKNDILSWDNILSAAIECANSTLEGNECIRKKDLQYLEPTFRFEYIANSMKGGKEKYAFLKKAIVDFLQENKIQFSDRMKNAILKVKADFIITTNYDNFLEENLLCHDYNFSKNTNKESNYLFKRTNMTPLKNKLYNTNFDIYHIHGIWLDKNEKYKSICLGFEHYNRITSLIASKIGVPNNLTGNFQTEQKMPKIIKYLKESLSSGDRIQMDEEFTTRFFDSDLSIVGLALSPAEIDIWYILIYRAYLFFSNIYSAQSYISNVISYYEIISREQIIKKVYPDSKDCEGIDKEKIVNDYLSIQATTFNKMFIEYIPILLDSGETYEQKYLAILDKIHTKIINSNNS